MNRQLAAVLWTYPQRIFSGVAPFVLVSISLVGIVWLVTGKIDFLALMSMYGVGLLAFHLKQQVNLGARRRLPNAIVWHVCVGMALLGLMSQGPPLVGMAIRGQWHWGYPGFVLAFTALIFATVVVQSSWFSWITVPLIWLAMTPEAKAWSAELSAGQLEGSGMLMFASGLAGIAGSLVWMLRLTEEDRGYHMRMVARGTDLYRRESVDTVQSEDIKRIWSSPWLAPVDPSQKTVALWAGWARGSLWNRTQLWTASRRLPLSNWIVPLVFPLFFFVPQWVNNRHVDTLVQPYYLIIATVFSTIATTASWIRQRSVWGVELLRPASRSQFFFELGLTLAKQLATLWLILVAVWFAATALLSPATLQGSSFWGCLMVSLLLVLFVFSFGVWIMRYRSSIVWFAALFGGMIVMQMFVVAIMFKAKVDSDVGLILGTIIAVAISAVMIWDAYRRWQTTELG